MENIQLDDKAVAYAYTAKNLATGEVEAEGVELPINIMRVHKSLTAEFLEVELTPLYELPKELEGAKDYYAE